MKKKVIKGDVFIIPNYARELRVFSKDWLKERLSRLAGIEFVRDDEKMIQLWITSDKCENWNHFAGFQKTLGIRKEDFRNNYQDPEERRLLGYFPNYFPSRIFEGKNEGDTVKIDCPEYDVIIKLTCKQLDYRYRDFGRFEEAFKYILKG